MINAASGSLSPAIRPWLWSRQRFAALGLLLSAVGLAHRLAFVVTVTGAALIVAGTVMLLLAALAPNLAPASDEESNLTFMALFVILAVVTALSPYTDAVLVILLTGAAAVTFVVLEAVPPARQFRLWLVAALLVLGHGLIILHLRFPVQDVFRFLTYGVDGLVQHGRNPYQSIPEASDLGFYKLVFTYPPGALVMVAPFRLLLGDVRWAYIAGEILFLLGAAMTVRRRGGLATWQQALLLTPLVLPRASQALFDYSNHEWTLLGLAAVAVALRRRWLWCGVLLGIGIAAKQYFILFPVAFLLPWVSVSALLTAAGTGLVIVVPFAVWDWRALFGSITYFPIPLPVEDRLTVYAMLRQVGLDIGRAGAAVLVGASLLVVAACAWLGRTGLARSLMACGAALAAFTLLAEYSAYNYYFYALAIFAWGVAAMGSDKEEVAGRVPDNLSSRGSASG